MEPILFFIVLFGFIIVLRYIQYRERMDMLNRGLTPKDYRPTNPPASGPPATDYITGTLLPPQYQQPSAYQQPGFPSRYSAEAIKRRTVGLIYLMIGLGLLFGLGTIGWGPWLMPGFIVTFVGLGLLINYYMSTDFAAPRPNQPQPPTSQQQPQPPQQPGYGNVPPAQAWDAKQWGAPVSGQVPPPPSPYMGDQSKRER